MQTTKRAIGSSNAEHRVISQQALAERAFIALLKGAEVDKLLAEAIDSQIVAPYAIVATMLCDADEEPLEVLAFMECEPVKSVHVSCENLAVALVSQPEAHRFANDITDAFKTRKAIVAFSLPFQLLDDIAPQFRLLKFRLNSADETGILNAQDAALPYLVAEINKAVGSKSLLHPALVKLAKYDAANQSNLLHTLKVYLEHDRNAQRCANMLYLHRNSLQYRIRRIQEIAGIDLDDPDERAYLRLSFLLS